MNENERRAVKKLRKFARNQSTIDLDPQLSEDILLLCDEVERLDKITNDLEKCRLKLSNYEPF